MAIEITNQVQTNLIPLKSFLGLVDGKLTNILTYPNNTQLTDGERLNHIEICKQVGVASDILESYIAAANSVTGAKLHSIKANNINLKNIYTKCLTQNVDELSKLLTDGVFQNNREYFETLMKDVFTNKHSSIKNYDEFLEKLKTASENIKNFAKVFEKDIETIERNQFGVKI